MIGRYLENGVVGVGRSINGAFISVLRASAPLVICLSCLAMKLRCALPATLPYIAYALWLMLHLKLCMDRGALRVFSQFIQPFFQALNICAQCIDFCIELFNMPFFSQHGFFFLPVFT